MAADDVPAPPRPPVVLRIKLRYDDVDSMVQRFALNIGKTGLFLPTKSLQTVGTEVKFELRLANDTPVLVGLGRVKAAQAYDEANPRGVFGMSVELMRVTRESRELILRMLEARKAMGLVEVALPFPSDIEAARTREPAKPPPRPAPVGSDGDVDLEAVLARARMITMSIGDLESDADLEALRDEGATPVAIDIEAASAELARQLGGSAVRRGDRSRRS